MKCERKRYLDNGINYTVAAQKLKIAAETKTNVNKLQYLSSKYLKKII